MKQPTNATETIAIKTQEENRDDQCNEQAEVSRDLGLSIHVNVHAASKQTTYLQIIHGSCDAAADATRVEHENDDQNNSLTDRKQTHHAHIVLP